MMVTLFLCRATRPGLPTSTALLPRKLKLFCPSVKTEWALVLPSLAPFVQQGGVVYEPAGLVEVREHAAPVSSLVLGL